MAKKRGKEKRKVNGKSLAIGIFIVLSLLALFILVNNRNEVSAAQSSVCCEKTTNNAWCQNSPPATCNGNYRQAPTSCQSTSFCKTGTCVDSQEGTCLPNVPQQVCQGDGGVWIEGDPDTIPQCQLGCCLVGDQAAFVTQTKCKSIAGSYGVNATFRTDITNELTCIASANPQVKGACVLDNGLTRDCRVTTRGDCNSLQASSSSNTTVEFHEGLLCTADSLATNCAPRKTTTCVPGKDQVYYTDSCGNVANVYDASKYNDKSYWTTIQDPSSSCNFGSSNANSASCGNCDYLLGSTCKPYQRGDPQSPTIGNNICADLSCKYDGKTYMQGESWCGNTDGADKSLPGSEYAVLSCFNGEVTTELCDAYRNKVCLQDTTDTSAGPFLSANCVVNRWQDCTQQTNKQDCENIDQRDCAWVTNTSNSILTDSNGKVLTLNKDGELVQSGGGQGQAACIPKYAPGFSFWNSSEDSSGGDAEAICAQVSQNCVVKFTKGLIFGSWKCKSNCECIGLKDDQSVSPGSEQGVQQWISQREGMCIDIGDCGNSTNYIGKLGYQSTNPVSITRQ